MKQNQNSLIKKTEGSFSTSPLAAKGAKIFLHNENLGIPTKEWIPVKAGSNISFVLPHFVSGENDVTFYARVEEPKINVKIRFPEIDLEIEEPSVNPGEMIQIEVTSNDLEDLSEILTMEVVV